jgi:hypothetical protein
MQRRRGMMVPNVVVNWREMEGESIEIQMLNALITSAHVGSMDMPADECLTHARAVLAMFHADGDWKPKVVAYLKSMFATGVNGKTGDSRSIPSMEPACVTTADRMGVLLRGGPWPDRLVLV